MASPQAENGHVDIANQIAEKLARVNLSSYEYRILWAVWRKTYGWHKKMDFISITQIQELTGLDRRNASRAKKSLLEKKVLLADGFLIGFNKDYDTWGVSIKTIDVGVSIKTTNIVSTDTPPVSLQTIPPVSLQTTTKENNTKEKRQYTSSAKSEDPSFSPKLEISPPPLPPPAEPKKECPHKEIISLYHSILPELNPVKVWNEFRKKTLQSRWRESPERRDLKWWGSFFRRIRESDFLMGRAKDFRADLEWLIRPKNFAAVLEGRYHRPAPPSGHQSEKTRYSGDCIDGAWEFIDGVPNQIYVMKKGEREIQGRKRQAGGKSSEGRPS